MKKLMFATALVASAAAFADPAVLQAGSQESMSALNAISFEGYTAGATFNTVATEKDEDGNNKSDGPYFLYLGEQDGSSVKTYGGDNLVAPSITRPYYFAQTLGNSNANYLDLSTEGGVLWRSINALRPDGETNILGLAQSIPEDGSVYLDTLVQFTPTEDGGTPELGDEDKLAIWLNVSEGVTNLMVRAAIIDDGFNLTPTNFIINNASVAAGTWYRLTIKALADVTQADEVPAFQIYLDGTLLTSSLLSFTDDYVDLIDSDYKSAIEGGSVFVSLLGVSSNPTVQAIGFKGSGALDDIVWTEEDPFPAPAAIDFTLSWPAGITPVSYTIDGGTPVLIDGSTTFPIQVADGSVVAFTFTNADGATKTMTATASSSVNEIDAADAVWTWADYLGDAVDGAYEIDNLAELKLFQKGIAITTNELKLATAGETFKLTADIALDEAWPGIGVQDGKDIYSTADFNAAAFQGTFDGQNHTISGFQMIGKGDKAEGLDYCGFFNSTYGATIQNLKIAYAGSLFAADTTSSTKESGATFVGVAKNSTLRNLTTVAGTVSCSKGFGGIVGYLTSGTTVDSCTNNVNMTSLAGNKCGGIAMIAQGGSAVTITNCQNNGTQTTTSSNSEYGAIVGYVGLDITIADCETTVGRFLKHQGNTVTLQGVNKGDATVLAYHGAATPGLNFATVDNGVATFVADDALELGGSYKVMSGNAAYAFASAGSITFDESLVSPTVTADAAYLLSQSGSGTVTYTAVLAVAEVTGGAKYATLQAAVDAATAGDTVTVLADCSVTNGTGITFTKGINLVNNYTITVDGANYAFRIANGTTTPVTLSGTGSLVWAKGSGSPILVGCNEKKTQFGIDAFCDGSFVLNGGYLTSTDATAKSGNLVKLESGTFVMNDGTINGGTRGVKADSEGNNATCVLTINGGTIVNTNSAAIAASTAGSGSSTVTINAGTFTGAITGTGMVTIPGTSTAKFDRDQTAFCAAGYETTDGDNDGWFTVTAKQAAGGYKVVIGGVDVPITPQAGDLEALAAAGVNTNSVDAVNAALATEIGTTGIPAWQAAFLGLPPTVAGLESFKIDSISIAADGKVTVTLPASVDPKTGRGVTIALKLMGSDDLSTWSFIENASGTTFDAVTPGSGETKKFYKVVVEFSATPVD